MDAEFPSPKGHGPRKSILDLAPLELECMNTLWPLGEASVRQIQQRLARSRPRAYTTIMTIMDRLAHKGVVERRKVGRAYLYRPNLTAEQARTHAVEQVVEGFFAGSAEALASHVSGGRRVPEAAARSAAAQVARDVAAGRAPLREPVPEPEELSADVGDPSAGPPETFPATRLDESLL